MGMVELFQNGGGWMYVIVLTAILNLALVIVQFVKRSPKLSHVLWGCFVALIVAGFAGTSVGMLVVGLAVENAAPEKAIQMFGRGVGIANGPIIFSCVFAFILAILTGIANSRAVKA